MMAKLAEDDRIEQMTAQRRRMRQQEHARAVQRMIEERQEQAARDKVWGHVIHVNCESCHLCTGT